MRKRLLVLFVALVYVAVLYTAFSTSIFARAYFYIEYHFRTTITLENEIQEIIPSRFNEDVRILKVNGYIVNGSSRLASRRDKDNVLITIEKASRVLNQADVNLEVAEIIEIEIPEEILIDDYDFTKNVFEYIETSSIYNPKQVNIVFTKRIKNSYFLQPSGSAHQETAILSLIDRSEGEPDFVILAHEIAHLFGSEDKYSDRKPGMLMSAMGRRLSDMEIVELRENLGDY